MMRDIIAYYVAEGPVSRECCLHGKDPARRPYLERFADREGTEFLTRFYRLYRNDSADDALSLLASRVRPVPERLAVVFRSVEESRIGALRVGDVSGSVAFASHTQGGRGRRTLRTLRAGPLLAGRSRLSGPDPSPGDMAGPITPTKSESQL